MAPSSPSNSSSSSSSDDSSNKNNSSLFLSLNAETKSSDSDSSPIEPVAPPGSDDGNFNTKKKSKASNNNNNTTPSSDDATTEETSNNHEKDTQEASTNQTKHGNSTVNTPVETSTSLVNSSAQAVPVVASSITSTTTNTSTSSGVAPSKPVLVQSKKVINPHQPMNAAFPIPPQLIHHHHHPQMFDPNAPPYQPPIRVANGNGKAVYPIISQGTVPNPLHYTYSFPAAHHQIPTAFYTPPHGSSIIHDTNAMYMPLIPPTIPEAEASSSDGSESEGSSDDDDEGYTIVTMQKPSPYTEMKKKYEDLMKLYTQSVKELNSVKEELNELKRRRVEPNPRGVLLPPSASSSPATKKKKIESPHSDAVRQANLMPVGVDKTQRTSYQQLETSISSMPHQMVPVSPSSDTSSSAVSLNTLVYIYYYDGGCDGHGSRQLKANGKRIFVDINWDEILKFRKDDCLHMCIFVNTSTVDKVKDSDLIATFKILRSDGDKVKISKIRENLRRLNLQNQFSHIGHIKFFIQIRGNDQVFDYTDKILLYSKTQHNIANFEPSNQKEYNELSKLFYQPERFTVFKKV